MFKKMSLSSAPILLAALLMAACGDGRDETQESAAPADDVSLPVSAIGEDTGPVDFSAFARPAGAKSASQIFTGRLSFDAAPERTVAKLVKDQFSIVDADGPDYRDLPPLDLDFIQVNDRLAPAHRGYLPYTDSFWEWVVEPGYVWEEPGLGGVSRAVIPASLQVNGWNCTHNGAITFLYRSSGEISDVYFQVAQETCASFHVDLAATASASYTPGDVEGAQTIASALEAELAGRMPTRPIADIKETFPAVDPSGFAAAEDLNPETLTLYGVIADGVHYVSGCMTRHGEFPFCDEVDLPSFSVAKSLSAALGLMRLEQLHSGAGAKPVADVVPECAAEGGWGGITLSDALDMATGRYVSDELLVDDETEISAVVHETLDHSVMVEFACTRYPVKTEPGKVWVYHTSDTYLVGLGLHELWRERNGRSADFFDDVLKDDVYKKLALSPTIGRPKRMKGEGRQPYYGSGLTYLRDDFAKLAAFFISADGRVDDEQLLPEKKLRSALQRDGEDYGIEFAPGERYNDSFWAVDVADIVGCSSPVWLSYALGYGGVALVIAPNDTAYYFVSDGEEYDDWKYAAKQLHAIRPLCSANE